MRKSILSLLLTCLLFTFGKAQDCLWVSPALGISSSGRSMMAHADVSATYLRYNRWGFSGNLQANGRTLLNTKNNTLKSYSGYGLQFAYNIFPYDENGRKLIARLGVCQGSGTFVNEYTGSGQATDSSMNQEQFYKKTEYASFGAEASIEFLFSHRHDRAFSFQFYSIIMRYPFFGFSIRYNLGAFD